jgi:hypothetical protein
MLNKQGYIHALAYALPRTQAQARTRARTHTHKYVIFIAFPWQHGYVNAPQY